MKKRGVSLIVLIVTIIVIIILAAVVILTLSKNNPIGNAKEASFKEDVRTFQDELAMYISKDYTSKAGQRDNKITETDSSKIKDYIPSFSKKYEGKFVIKNDELMYNENITTQEKEWCKELNIKINAKTGAEKAKESPQKYYGAKVDYKTGNTAIDSDITEWKIFYSDGTNVYIISSEYVDPSNLPEKDGAKPANTNSSCPKAAPFDNIIIKYSGSTNITDEKMKAFNSDYFDKKYTSAEDNMKAVAYMLDKEIWSELYANTTVAECAVGGPSVEIFLKSYSEKNNVDYRAQASSAIGYQVSANGGKSYAIAISGMLSISEDLYVLPQNKGAKAMWLASTSAYNGNYVRDVAFDGGVRSNTIDGTHGGFRPLVCLNSNVLLNEVEGGFEIE